MNYNYHDFLHARLIEAIGRYKKRLTIFFSFGGVLLTVKRSRVSQHGSVSQLPALDRHVTRQNISGSSLL